MDATTTNFIQAIFAVGVFMIFVSAITEVIKALSGRGAWNMLKELVVSLVKNSPLSTESIKVLTFVIGLICCRAFDFGIMMKVIQFGANYKEGLAGWIDYIGTASVMFMGADWAYNQFMALKNKAIAAQGPKDVAAPPAKAAV